ncbi:MAG: hypothetical protein ABSC46_04920 [Candidatus Limnocylindrales bacterium]|jgi:hypothetical protein
MIQPVVAAALIAAIGGVVAIAARDGRVVALGLLIAMVATPFVASPEPTALAVVFRVLGSLLAAYLLLAAARSQSIASEGSGIGVLAETAVAGAAFSIGWFIVPVEPLTGPLAAQAAGVTLVALAIVPLTGRDVFRVGVGAAVLVIGGSLLFQAWIGPASSVGQIVLTALLVAVAGATGLLISPFDAMTAMRGTAAEAPAAVPSAAGELSADSGAEIAPDAAGEAALTEAAPAVPAPLPRRPAARKTARSSAAPIPADASPTPTRASTIRTSPFGPLRGEGWTDPSRPLGGETSDEETEIETPEPLPEVFPTPGRVRRLRPREPRR